jgi:hypothetical protein
MTELRLVHGYFAERDAGVLASRRPDGLGGGTFQRTRRKSVEAIERKAQQNAQRRYLETTMNPPSPYLTC